MRGESLKRFNPVPYLVQLLQEIHGLRARTGSLHAVLSELYSNALEHGVLGLDSRLKRDGQGFADYYQERARRLGALTDGFVRIDFTVEPHADGGRLYLNPKDSKKIRRRVRRAACAVAAFAGARPERAWPEPGPAAGQQRPLE